MKPVAVTCGCALKRIILVRNTSREIICSAGQGSVHLSSFRSK